MHFVGEVQLALIGVVKLHSLDSEYPTNLHVVWIQVPELGTEIRLKFHCPNLFGWLNSFVVKGFLVLNSDYGNYGSISKWAPTIVIKWGYSSTYSRYNPSYALYKDFGAP